ncbi:double-strand break repair protein AddB [Acetobacter orleanensis]|uniref:Double-strand break repair protein AddB n=1 Tax=Acetobacter orleanensis TaxID=104099 RepID=A0A4Y3TP64_9PROT|nr:double-strand break repair protein AddB [Acetobacter orleanensis]KXV62312.1 nuclease [Acetobacter orleanensis]PCD79471.1 double-strand break repair protein AddB [Acetobacter orleanensis]GAN69130.1 nuclease [Acetobacter orleanensis JCM 7639]GEB82605.1 double-strand break repair protein AddB [Acetobacter orleanensis]
MSLATIPAHLPFLDQLATRWLQAAEYHPEVVGEGTIILPGRRAARGLTEAFLRQMDGRAMLLPRILPVSALDEAELGLASDLGGQTGFDLPPAVAGMTRLAVLTRFVLQAEGAFGTRPTLDQAWPLAKALADLMDEAEWADVDLATRLPEAVQENFAEHWQVILKFLEIVTRVWPDWLASQQVMNPVARQVMLLRAQARLWQEQAVQGDKTPIWAAGFTNVMPATAEALRAVLSRAGGKVILPGLDLEMPEETFVRLPDSHPQAGLSHLLAALDRVRADVELWKGEGGFPERAQVLSRALLPASALEDWARSGPTHLAQVSRLDAADQQEEAVAIAMILRNVVETPEKRVALVTPDRALAARVATELARWGVLADDSAGASLIETPGAVLLRLVAQMVENRFSPVSVLSVLKHPLVSCGLSMGTCRATARLLERTVLRGPAPPPGFAALRGAVTAVLAEQAKDERARERAEGGAEADRPYGPEPLEIFMDRLAFCLEPILPWDTRMASAGADRLAEGPEPEVYDTPEGDAADAGAVGEAPDFSCREPVPDLLAALIQAVERLVKTDEEDAAKRLWSGEEGNSLAGRLTELMMASDVLPPQPPAVLDGLLSAVLAEDRVAVRRGVEHAALHPRVLIWGLFEARLQTADVVVLGGLAENIWPPAADAGPWMSRPMRQRVGLPSPEQAVGQAAHDFFACAAAAGEVVLSCPRRRDGAPVVPARWISRLDAFLSGRGLAVPPHPVLDWLQVLDRPDGPARPVAPPRPTPPVSLRPRRLSVTEIETWVRDPYAIYARHILKLQPLPELEEAADASDYGMIVHDALEDWFLTHGTTWPPQAEAGLQAAFRKALQARALRPVLQAWWEPRLMRIASWVAQAETALREQAGTPAAIRTESRGRVDIPDAPHGAFRLVGRADRIDYDTEGRVIVRDYKTGTLPSVRDVRSGWSPQLPLEAAMILRGGFSGLPATADIAGLVYWRLTGGAEPGEEVAVKPEAEASLTALAEQTWESLRQRVWAYDSPEQPYLSHPHPGREPRFADYARLARVPEWNTTRMEDEA